MGSCESSKNPNQKVIQSQKIKKSETEKDNILLSGNEIMKQNQLNENKLNNNTNNINNINQNNIDKENLEKKKNSETKQNNLPELPRLRRIQRLKSECVNHHFKFLSNNQFEDEEEDKVPNDINLNNVERKKYNKTPISYTIKNNSLSFQRKQSMKYCNDFKKKTQSGGKYLLNYLANSLMRNTINEDQPKNIKYYNPEFIIDWRYIKNENTDLFIWKNFGQIPLTQELINSIIQLDYNQISSCENFYKKRIWFYNYIQNNVLNNNNNNNDNNNNNPILVINRNNILEESYNQFISTKDLNLKKPIQIHFIDEKAHDSGGVYREWYSSLFKEFFKEKYKLFIENNNQALNKGTYLIYPKYNNMKIDYYEFFGKLAAKALIDQVNISQILNRTVLKYIRNEKVELDDLKYYDMELYKSLKKINDTNNINSNENYKEFKFIWNIKDENKNIKEIELIPGGNNIYLNDENKNLFIEKIIYIETLMNYEEQIQRIKKGFLSFFGNEINIFKIEEFDFELSGQRTIDIEDWKKNTIYKGHYNENNNTIKIFWEVLSNLSQNDLFIFYNFCTSSNHVPLDGFNSLKGINNKIQKFTIEPKLSLILDESDNNFKLIEAKTCFNRILLPEYSSKDDMEKAINIIIGNDTSYFGLE